ncbi:MAG: lipocalin family protein [Bacteroidetes bacterium]|nr:lipocalin family protein [Bacteroidota bacterium]
MRIDFRQKRLLFICLFALLSACSGPDELVGKWQVLAVEPDESKGPAPQMVKDLLQYLRGAEYTIREDGTFHKTGSFEDVAGTWTRTEDTYTLSKKNGFKEIWIIRSREKEGYVVTLKSQSDNPDMFLRIRRIGGHED